jgi:hypothetical protein
MVGRPPRQFGSKLTAEIIGANPVPPIERPRGGRPMKAGPEAQPVNVRLGVEDYERLASLAGELRERGRPPVTVQDVIRRVARGALHDVETLKRLYVAGA